MSVQGDMNIALAALEAARKELAESRAAYDRLLHRCRYAEGVVRDLSARCETAAKSLGDGK